MPMDKQTLLATAANRWPQDLRESAYHEWSAELAAMDRSAPDTLRNRWRKFRFVWSLLMSKPPQVNTTPFILRIPQRAWAVLGLYCVGLVLGAVMPLGRLVSMDAESLEQAVWFSFAFLLGLVAVSVASFQFGLRSRLLGDMPRTTVVISVMLGGASSLLAIGAVGAPLKVPGLMAYYVLLVVALVLLGQGLHELVQRGQFFFAWLFATAGPFVFLNLITWFLPEMYRPRFMNFGTVFELTQWGHIPYDVASSLVVAATIPMVTLIVGRSLRQEREPKTETMVTVS